MNEQVTRRRTTCCYNLSSVNANYNVNNVGYSSIWFVNNPFICRYCVVVKRIVAELSGLVNRNVARFCILITVNVLAMLINVDI